MLSELGFPPHSPSIHDDPAQFWTQAQGTVSVYQSPKGGWRALLAVRDRLANTGDMRRSHRNDHTKHGALPGRPVYQSHPSARGSSRESTIFDSFWCLPWVWISREGNKRENILDTEMVCLELISILLPSPQSQDSYEQFGWGLPTQVTCLESVQSSLQMVLSVSDDVSSFVMMWYTINTHSSADHPASVY